MSTIGAGVLALIVTWQPRPWVISTLTGAVNTILTGVSHFWLVLTSVVPCRGRPKAPTRPGVLKESSQHDDHWWRPAWRAERPFAVPALLGLRKPVAGGQQIVNVGDMKPTETGAVR